VLSSHFLMSSITTKNTANSVISRATERFHRSQGFISSFKNHNVEATHSVGSSSGADAKAERSTRSHDV
jgi:hypothetical protein